LIGQSKEIRIRSVDAKTVQSRHGFRTSQFCPAFSINFSQPPLAIQQTLRPRIIITICGIKDANGRPGADSALQNNAASERFVIGVRRDQHQSRSGCKLWSRREEHFV
jgi:hypothetical protein